MSNMTLSIPEALHKRMMRHAELEWETIAKTAFERKISEIEFMEKALSKSKLTEEEAERIGHKIKSEMRKRFA